MLKGKHVVLGITGSIAAYKTAGLASMLVKKGCHVQVLMTENATNFINPITFETLTGNKCLVDTFDRNFEFSVEHVALAKQADVVMIAPASANIIAKLAHGLADDMLTTTVLAELFDYIEKEIGAQKDLEGRKILVTAGPTREAIDPVRYITNHSTGKMGYAVAKAAALRGADVTLITGKTDTPKPRFVKLIEIESARDMFEAVTKAAAEQDIIIKAAAVADYRPKSAGTEKTKKTDGDLAIELERTDDILGWLGQNRRDGQFLCGFSMETQNMLENSRAKLAKKHIDMIVANNLKVEGAGFGTDTNVATLLFKDGHRETPPMMSKEALADLILDRLLAMSN